MRLDPHRREVLGQLERALNTASAGGREVEADDQRLHGGDRNHLADMDTS